jgi:hypothetical protein
MHKQTFKEHGIMPGWTQWGYKKINEIKARRYVQTQLWKPRFFPIYQWGLFYNNH